MSSDPREPGQSGKASPSRPTADTGDLVRLERRQLLKAGAAASLAGSAGSLLSGCASEREQRVLEQVVGSANDNSGVTRWVVTSCGQCPAGCGIEVRVVDRDAKKIEGLPGHPVSGGGVCALGQSAPQQTYDPDRLLAPLLRGGRGAPQGPASWQEALSRVAEALRRSKADGGLAILTDFRDSLENRLFSALAREAGGRHFFYEPVWRAAERAAAETVFGDAQLPAYDLEAADLVVSFGAPLLDGWRNPVWAAAALKTRGQRRRRPTLVQIEPRMSLTGANADLWIAPRVGSEAALARALSRVLAPTADGEGAAANAEPEDPRAALAAAAARCDVPLERLERLVGWVRAAERPVFVAAGAWVSGAGSDPGAPPVTVEVLRLNQLLGRIGRPGGVFPTSGRRLQLPFDPPGPEALPPPEPLPALLGRLRAGEVSTLLVVEVDPLREASEATELEQALESVDHLICIDSVLGDTALRADVVLPSLTALERWRFELAEPSRPGELLVASETAIPPVAADAARHPAALAADLATGLVGAGEEPRFPAADAAGVDGLFAAAVAAAAEEVGLRPAALLEQGFRWRDVASTSGELTVAAGAPASGPARFADRGGLESADLSAETLPAERQPADGLAATDASRYTLLPFDTPHLGDGRAANRTWLQQLPDPLTTVMWGAWAELASADVRRLGLRTGQWIELGGPAGAGTLPVAERPAARPGAVAGPRGCGHLEGGRWARQRGVNVHRLGALAVAGIDRASAVGVEVTLRPASAPAGAAFAQFGRGLRHPEDLPRRRGRPLRQAETRAHPGEQAKSESERPAAAGDADEASAVPGGESSEEER